MTEQQYYMKYLIAMGILIDGYEHVEKSLGFSIKYLNEIMATEYYKSLLQEPQIHMAQVLRDTIETVEMQQSINQKLQQLFNMMLLELQSEHKGSLTELHNELLKMLTTSPYPSEYEVKGIIYCVAELEKIFNS